MKKICLIAFVICIALFLTGCPKGRAKMPDVISDKIKEYAVVQFDEDYKRYNVAVDSNQLVKAKVLRNELLFKLKRHIDANYADFENNLFLGKATSNVLLDITELGAAAAVGITNGERAKTIIGTALTAFKGGRKSVDVNFFRERTTESLISTMRASRSRVEEKINLGLRNDVANYTLEESLGDLINYFYAGSLSNALVELSQQAADEAKNAKVQTDISIKKRLEVEFDESKDINTIRNELAAGLNSTDETKKAAARAALLRALEILQKDLPDLKVTFNANDTNENLFKELQRILRAAALMEEIPTATILRALKKQ
jgi:hypothetical protein